MVRLTKLILACTVLLCVASSSVAQEAHETWLKLCVGKWKASGSAGPDFQVVGKSMLDGKAVLFESVTDDGVRNVGLLGWESDKKRLVETGYGAAGDYYQFIYTDVTDKELKGRYIERTADGAMLDGDWHVWRTSDDVMEWKFDGKKDGKPHTFTGKHVRVK